MAGAKKPKGSGEPQTGWVTHWVEWQERELSASQLDSGIQCSLNGRGCCVMALTDGRESRIPFWIYCVCVGGRGGALFRATPMHMKVPRLRVELELYHNVGSKPHP